MPDQKVLSLHELRNLDAGRVAVAFDQDLRFLAKDCLDRPGDKRARTLTLVVELEPTIDDDGQCESVKGSFRIAARIPSRQSKTYDFGVRRGGQLVFNQLLPDSDEEPDQKPLDGKSRAAGE